MKKEIWATKVYGLGKVETHLFLSDKAGVEREIVWACEEHFKGFEGYPLEGSDKLKVAWIGENDPDNAVLYESFDLELGPANLWDVLTPAQMHTAYEGLVNAMYALEKADAQVTEQRKKIDAQAAVLYAQGAIDGKNEETRKGQLRAALAHLYIDLDTFETVQTESKSKVEIYKVRCEYVKTLIRAFQTTQYDQIEL